MLAYCARTLFVARRHRKDDFARGRTGTGMSPQLVAIAVGQAAVVLGPHQPIDRCIQFARTAHHRHQVCLAVGDIYQPCVRHVGGHLGDAFIAFDPARARSLPMAHTVSIAHFTRPHPCIEHAQRFPGRA